MASHAYSLCFIFKCHNIIAIYLIRNYHSCSFYLHIKFIDRDICQCIYYVQFSIINIIYYALTHRINLTLNSFELKISFSIHITVSRFTLFPVIFLQTYPGLNTLTVYIMDSVYFITQEKYWKLFF
jgi:hypothetical protein